MELQMKPEKKEATVHRFLDLVTELRGLIYEHIAHDTTIQISYTKNWKNWPAICFASRQTYDEALPIFCRCAAFEATVTLLDFSHLIGFTNGLSSTCLQALSCNNRLTIFFGNLRGLGHKDWMWMYSTIHPWLSLCRSLAGQGNDIQWYYVAAFPADHDRDYPGLYLKLHVCGYEMLKEVYAMLKLTGKDQRTKDEVAGMLLALLTFASYCHLPEEARQ